MLQCMTGAMRCTIGMYAWDYELYDGVAGCTTELYVDGLYDYGFTCGLWTVGGGFGGF